MADNLAEANAPSRLAEGVVRLHPWQQRWFRDPARVLVVNAHRQSGKDFAAAAVACDSGLSRREPWFIVSITQRQADATFEKCKSIAEAMRRAARRRAELRLETSEFEEYDRALDHTFRRVARTIHLPGGGSVTALPGRDPDTLAGLTGSVIFTEFGLFPKGGYDHWRVVFPLSTRGYRVIVISTPRGKNTKFYDLCRDDSTYAVHTQTILDSVAEGFVLYDNRGEPTDLATFRGLYGDEAGWRREYLCEFTGDLEALIRWALLEAAGQRPAPVEFRCIELTGRAPLDPKALAVAVPSGGRLEVGWDVARTGNISAVWANLALAGEKHLARLVLMRNCEFALQREVVSALLAADRSAVGRGDATGLGADSNETLAARFPGRWEGLVFTASSRRRLASRLATAYGDGDQGLPPVASHKYIHADIYALQKTGAVGSKDLQVEASANPLLEDSHADLAWANALALEAAESAPSRPWITAV